MSNPVKPRRVFIASPTDVGRERERAAEVVRALADEARDRDPFEPFRWEHQPDRAWNAGEGWQKQTPRPSAEDCEVLICVLGEKVGSPLPDTDPLPEDFVCPEGVLFPCPDEAAVYAEGDVDGDIPLTGTLFEYLDALHAFRAARQGSKGVEKPKILLFIKGDASVTAVGAPAHERRWGMGAWHADLVTEHGGKVLPPAVQLRYWRQTTFLSRFFDRFLAHNRSSWELFSDLDDFAQKLESSLRQALGLERQPWRKGNPYKRLEHYETDESAVFCGRAEEVRMMINRLSEADGRSDRIPCLVLKGDSGRGKSSVLRAGLAAALQTNRYRATTRARFRSCVVTPTQLHEPHPLLALVERLGQTVLSDLGPDVLKTLAGAPDDFRVTYALQEVKRALQTPEPNDERAAASGQESSTKLFLAIDQFEEVLQYRAGEDGARWASLLKLLLELAEERLAFTAIGLKPDWEVQLSRWLTEAELASPNALVRHDLDYPNWDLIVEEPLARCGLEVDDELREYLVAQAKKFRSLPLLSVALHRIYEKREWLERQREKAPVNPLQPPPPIPTTLTKREYMEEADLAAAIQRLGEQAYRAAAGVEGEEKTQELLSRVLRHLIRVPAHTADYSDVLLRDCPVGELPDSTGPVVGALKTNRLIIEKDQKLRLVHETVLDHWSRAKTWLDAEREHLKTQSELAAPLRYWVDNPTKENTQFVFPRLVDKGEQMVVAWRDEQLEPDLVAFVKAAIRYQVDQGNHHTYDGNPRLVDAVRLRDPDLVADMLEAGADPNARTNPRKQPDGSDAGESTALMFAAWDGSEDLVRQLIEHDAGVDQTDKQGHTALFYAATSGHAGIVRLLHEEHGAQVEGSAGRWTPLTAAAWGGHAEATRYLLDAGADVQGAEGGWTAIMAAAQGGHPDVIELLIKDGDVNLNEQAVDGMTALMLASVNGHEDAVRRLLASGAAAIEPATRKEGRTALHLAAANGHHGVVRAITERIEAAGRAALLNSTDTRRYTALHLAAEEGHAPVTAALLESGADPIVHAAGGQSPLATALKRDRSSVVALLVEAGAKLPPWYALTKKEDDVRITRLHGNALRSRLQALCVPSADTVAGERLPPPLVAGSWASLDRDEAVELLLEAGECAPEGLGCGVERVDAIRQLKLSFYPDVVLCEARVWCGDAVVGYLTFIQHGDEVTWLDGTSPRIHALNAKLPIRLDSDEDALGYLRFFTSAVHGEEGAFTMFESGDRLIWLDGAPGDVRARARALAQPARVQRESDGAGSSWLAETVMIYGSAIFATQLRIHRTGNIVMLDDSPQAADLGVYAEVFSDGVRTLRPAR